MSLRFSLLAGAALLLSPLAAAQAPQIDFAPTAVTVFGNERVAPIDSLFYDSGDNDVQFTIGFGFPGGTATPSDPKTGARAPRYVAEVLYTVPDDRAAFVLTGMNTRYRTSTVSGATSTPARVQYDADAPPIVKVFRGNQSDEIAVDSLSAPNAVFQAELPYTTATVESTADGYMVPVPENVFVNFLEDGETTVSDDLRFAPGDEFIIQIQFFNVPFPMQIEAGNDAVDNERSRGGGLGEQLTEADFVDLLTFAGPGNADTVGADGLNDQWFIRAISDDALFAVASESAATSEQISLGAPAPNPSAGIVNVPFTVEKAGSAVVSVYDVTGRRVATLVDGTVAAGNQSATLDASRLAAGVYAVVLEAEGERVVRTLSVVR